MLKYKMKQRCEARTWRSGYTQDCGRIARLLAPNESNKRMIWTCRKHALILFDKQKKTVDAERAKRFEEDE